MLKGIWKWKFLWFIRSTQISK